MKSGNTPKYEIVIFWEPIDRIFVADVPDLPGCMAHGDTQAEALESVHDAMDLWLEVARERGVMIPEPQLHRLAA